MSTERKKLHEALCRYITETLTDIHTVRWICKKFSKWVLWRETEVDMLRDIKDRADKVNLSFIHVTQSKTKGTTFMEFMESKFTNADRRYKELEKELTEVLMDTLGGLKNLEMFLDAVEKLAVTSLHVFTENKVFHLSEEIDFDDVQAVITAARLICPLLLVFKRDTKVFFLPKRQNLDVLAYQLDRYIQTTKNICEKMDKSCFSDWSLEKIKDVEVDINEGLSESDTQRMLDHINQLQEIRMDPCFRTVFLFQQKSCHDFIKEFKECQTRMLEFLNKLEESAVQLDRMNKGARISGVAGSSVGAVGGVLSIVGLALIPVTAGVSLALTMTGVGLGVTSGVNSLVTTATEMGVNHTHQKKANEVFQNFMEDVQSIQDCLEEVTRQTNSIIETSKIDVAVGVTKVIGKTGLVGRSIDSGVDLASGIKLFKAEEVVSSAGKVAAQEGAALRNVPRMASEIPDVGQAAAKGGLVLSKSARAGLIAGNALFLGMDIFFICKDSISLAKGSETEISKFIRARAALWSSEIDSWKKIHDSLDKGLETSGKKEAILETPFYPDVGMENYFEIKLHEALCRYITETLTDIHTVREFCERFSEWILWRETEVDMLRDIKERADKVNLGFSHVTQSKTKGTAFVEFMKSKFTNADSSHAEFGKELTEVLKDTLGGLEKLEMFLDAVEKLAVTSLHVFTENQVFHLPEEINFDDVQAVITAARLICPLLLVFKRDTKVFFLPKRQNLDVLAYQLDRYIQTTKNICEKMDESCFSDWSLKKIKEVEVDINEGLSESDTQRMLDHINQLQEIRMDPCFRTVFLFQESCHDFIKEFKERHTRMLKCLNELEESAVQLDRMNKGAKISSVAGSSVGAVGGVLSIAGLALIPVTAGVSLALTMAGVGMGVTSGVNNIVTTATEVGVIHTYQKKANEVFQNFMEDVQSIQDCLEDVTRQTDSIIETSKIDVAVGVTKVIGKAGAIGKTIDSAVDLASGLKLLKAEEVVSSAGKAVVQEGAALRNVPRMASEIPDVGQAAAKGGLALSESARTGLIDVSQFIRARAALWSSEIDSWKKIHDSLDKGLETSGKKEAILETPFYPDVGMEK